MVGSKDAFTDDLLNMGYSKGYRNGRADAIDEFSDLLKEHIEHNGTKTFTDGMQMAIFSKHYVDELAKELKERK